MEESLEKKRGDKEEPKYRGWKAMPYIIGTFDRLGTQNSTCRL